MTSDFLLNDPVPAISSFVGSTFCESHRIKRYAFPVALQALTQLNFSNLANFEESQKTKNERNLFSQFIRFNDQSSWESELLLLSLSSLVPIFQFRDEREVGLFG